MEIINIKNELTFKAVAVKTPVSESANLFLHLSIMFIAKGYSLLPKFSVNVIVFAYYPNMHLEHQSCMEVWNDTLTLKCKKCTISEKRVDWLKGLKNYAIDFIERSFISTKFNGNRECFFKVAQSNWFGYLFPFHRQKLIA